MSGRYRRRRSDPEVAAILKLNQQTIRNWLDAGFVAGEGWRNAQAFWGGP